MPPFYLYFLPAITRPAATAAKVAEVPAGEVAAEVAAEVATKQKSRQTN